MAAIGQLDGRRVLVVANPIAGRGRSRRAAEEVVERLRGEGCEVELVMTAARGDAERAAAERGPRADLIVSVGGDGTLAEVLGGLEQPVPVSVLAMGTANVLRQDLGLAHTAGQLVEQLRTGRVSELDVAMVRVGPEREARVSFLVTGVGFDGEAVRLVEQRRRGPITRWIYVRALLDALRSWRAEPLELELDGEVRPDACAWVLCSNVGGYGGVWRLSRERRIDDGLFEVYLLPARSRLAVLGLGLRGLLLGLPSGGIEMQRVRHLRVRAASPVAVEVDGDHAGVTPVELEVQPARARIVVPS